MYLAHSPPTLIHPISTYWSSFSPPVLCPSHVYSVFFLRTSFLIVYSFCPLLVSFLFILYPFCSSCPLLLSFLFILHPFLLLILLILPCDPPLLIHPSLCSSNSYSSCTPSAPDSAHPALWNPLLIHPAPPSAPDSAHPALCSLLFPFILHPFCSWFCSFCYVKLPFWFILPPFCSWFCSSCPVTLPFWFILPSAPLIPIHPSPLLLLILLILPSAPLIPIHPAPLLLVTCSWLSSSCPVTLPFWFILHPSWSSFFSFSSLPSQSFSFFTFLVQVLFLFIFPIPTQPAPEAYFIHSALSLPIHISINPFLPCTHSIHPALSPYNSYSSRPFSLSNRITAVRLPRLEITLPTLVKSLGNLCKGYSTQGYIDMPNTFNCQIGLKSLITPSIFTFIYCILIFRIFLWRFLNLFHLIFCGIFAQRIGMHLLADFPSDQKSASRQPTRKGHHWSLFCTQCAVHASFLIYFYTCTVKIG